jgi:acyl-CoA synthetase (AMP-forming)/AMP-acid ligase II
LNVAAFLHRAALLWPARPALALGARTVATYRDLARQAAILARNLRERLGLVPGERAAIAMTNCPDYMVVKYAGAADHGARNSSGVGHVCRPTWQRSR